MAAVTEAGTRQWNIWKAAHPDYRAVMWMGKRAFLKKWARTAMDRAGPQGSVEAWEAEYERLFQMVLDMAFAEKTFCYLCGVELTYDRRMFAGLTSEDVGGLLITTTNFSPDRRVPGTLYGLQTTEPCCWGCNCVKGGYPEANARVLLDTLAAADHTLDDDYFMIPVPSPATAEASAAGDDYNWRVEK